MLIRKAKFKREFSISMFNLNFYIMLERIKHAVEWYCEKAANNYVWSPLPMNPNER